MSSISPPEGLEAGTTQADVVVVCVTYNSAAIVGPMLEALPAALESIPSCRVVFTDNGSVDGTPELIRELAPWITLVDAGRNAGYAGGINLAMRQCFARRGVYILNPDAIPARGSVSKLLAVAENQPQVGIAVPIILSLSGDLKYSLRREPTLLRAVGEALLGGRRAARFSLLGDMIRDPEYYQDGAAADWATGAAMFIARRAIDAVGDWDERFFLYSEETDYALRVRDARLRLQLATNATVVHPGGLMSSSPYLWSLVATNRTRLYRKRHSLARSLIYWGVVVANEGMRSVLGRETHRAAFKALLAVGPNPPETLRTSSLVSER